MKAALRGKLERTGRFCMEVSEALQLVFDYEEKRRGTANMVADSGMREDGATPMDEAPVQEVSPVPEINPLAFLRSQNLFSDIFALE